MSVKLAREAGYVPFFRRTPSKLPKVDHEPVCDQTSSHRNKTGWFRWPFLQRLEALREEPPRRKLPSHLHHHHHHHHSDEAEQGTEPVLKSDAGYDRIMINAVVSENRGGVGSHTVMNYDGRPTTDIGQHQGKSNELTEVKRRPKPKHHHNHHHNHHTSKCNDVTTSVHRNKRMSYPPCETVGLHVYLERLHAKDTKITRSPAAHTTASNAVAARLSNAFSTSCPALYNPKCAERLSNYESHHRRHERRHSPPIPPIPVVNKNNNSEHLKPVKHHHRATDSLLEHTTKIHRINHVKPKIRKTKSHPNREGSSRLQRPKPPSWQDQSNDPDPPSVTITEPTANDAVPAAHQCITTSSMVEKEHYANLLKAESVSVASSVLESEHRGPNRRSAGLLSRSHLKRTRSRVIDAREIPKESPVIPLSKTQQDEFNLKETHQDNEIYLNENAQRCRKWLANLEVEDLRDQPIRSSLSSGVADDSNDVITLDLEVSHDRWNYLGSPYPSDSGSEND